jgi:hypothetical protein
MSDVRACLVDGRWDEGYADGGWALPVYMSC